VRGGKRAALRPGERDATERVQKLTHVARCAAGRGHDPRVLHLGQAKVADHDFTVLVWTVVQQVLWLHTKCQILTIIIFILKLKKYQSVLCANNYYFE